MQHCLSCFPGSSEYSLRQRSDPCSRLQEELLGSSQSGWGVLGTWGTAKGRPWACSKVNSHLAAAQKEEDVGTWRSRKGLIHVLLWEQASHMFLV